MGRSLKPWMGLRAIGRFLDLCFNADDSATGSLVRNLVEEFEDIGNIGFPFGEMQLRV